MKKGVIALVALFAIVFSVAAQAAELTGAIGLKAEYEQKLYADNWDNWDGKKKKGDKDWGDYSPYIDGWIAKKGSPISFNWMLLKTYVTTPTKTDNQPINANKTEDFKHYERSRIQLGVNYGGSAGDLSYGFGVQIRNQFQTWGYDANSDTNAYRTRHENIWAARFIISGGYKINDMINLGTWNLITQERRKRVVGGTGKGAPDKTYKDYDVELGLSAGIKLGPGSLNLHVGFLDEHDKNHERTMGWLTTAGYSFNVGPVSLNPHARYEKYKYGWGGGDRAKLSDDWTRISARLGFGFPIVETVSFNGLVYHRWETLSPEGSSKDKKLTFRYFDGGFTKTF